MHCQNEYENEVDYKTSICNDCHKKYYEGK